ncbi:GNAT family N-acetyltransferase [Bacillus sp. V5-8f]|uniref:GNAT family N-acetyltransferase n=1 Tax=Bacillus sp. V5-8f TaxID=2053044 RepID=UPI000C78C678|nr:GNAT family N-acetyltransferase [Bacillus sp. V5-8f]PLT32128.1 hypothetical protein CUU64_21450 [Bacillus sp. V5-8f]
MIKKVNSTVELNVFNSIWLQCWEEKGYEAEFSEHVFGRYLVSNSAGEHIGVFEFKKLTHSLIDEEFPFTSFAFIKDNIEKTLELDKLSILPSYRGGKVLSEMLTHMIKVAVENDISYFIALIEPKLYLALKRFYKAPIQKLGDVFFYKGDNVVPISIDLKLVINNIENYDWYNDSVLVRIKNPTGYE